MVRPNGSSPWNGVGCSSEEPRSFNVSTPRHARPMERRWRLKSMLIGASAITLLIVVLIGIDAPSEPGSRDLSPIPITVEYWNSLYQIDERTVIPDWQKEWPDCFRRVMDELAALPRDGIDPLAVGTCNRMQALLSEMANLTDHLNWTNEHPVQAEASVTFGGDVLPKARARAQACRSAAIELNSFARLAHEHLLRRYPDARLAAPTPVPLGDLDAFLAELDAIENYNDLGALIGLFLGGL